MVIFNVPDLSARARLRAVVNFTRNEQASTNLLKGLVDENLST